MRVFLCPALMDVVLFAVGLAVSYGAGQRGMSDADLAWLAGIMQAAYMVGSPVSGLLLTRRNARAALILGTVGSVAAGVVCLVFEGFWPIFAGMAAQGVFAALFFNAFQTFARGDAPPGGLAHVTGMYVLSWSAGAAVGTLLTGSLFKVRLALAGATVAVGLLILVILVTYKSRSHDELSAEEHSDGAGTDEERLHAPYVWIGWILIFAVVFVQRSLMAFYPKQGALQGVSPMLVAVPLVLHWIIQSLSGFRLRATRRAFYRLGPLAATQMAAAAVLGALWLVRSPLLTGVGITLLGVWSAFGYFCAAYYAGNAGHRSRNTGINESLVGAGTIVGLIFCERFLKLTGDFHVIYAVFGAAVLLLFLVQWLIAAKAAKSASPSPEA